MKTFLSLFMIVVFVFTTNAQDKRKKLIPPDAVKAAFVKSFPAASRIKWTNEKNQYEVNFLMGGKEMSANYEASGAWLETETEIKISDLPASVIRYVQQHGKGAKIKEAAKINRASGEVNYEAEVKGKDLIFDEKGNFLRQE